MNRPLALLSLLFMMGCATANVDMTEPRRVVGTENGVRIDGSVRGDILTINTQIPLTWDVTNERQTPIAVADMIPESTYDSDSQTVVVNLGSEVPGENLVPRLIVIAPGEKKSFTGTVRVRVQKKFTDPTQVPPPHMLQLKLSFLSDVEPFTELVGMTQKAVNDPALADKLFPLWIERNEILLTNTVPMRWRDVGQVEATTRPATRRR